MLIIAGGIVLGVIALICVVWVVEYVVVPIYVVSAAIIGKVSRHDPHVAMPKPKLTQQQLEDIVVRKILAEKLSRIEHLP